MWAASGRGTVILAGRSTRSLDRMRKLGGTCIAAMVAYGCAAPPAPLPVEPFPTSLSKGNECVPISRVDARYPRVALNSAQSGWVIVDHDVAPDGTVSNLRVVASSPKGIFDGQAVASVRQWKFPPGAPREGCRLEFRFQM